jgi:hypothetical protein
MGPMAWGGHIGYPPQCSGMIDLSLRWHTSFFSRLTYIHSDTYRETLATFRIILMCSGLRVDCII